MLDPLHPPAAVIIKLGSALVHAEEMSEPGAHPLDLEAFRAIASDPAIMEWRQAMDGLALLPLKRSERV